MKRDLIRFLAEITRPRIHIDVGINSIILRLRSAISMHDSDSDHIFWKFFNKSSAHVVRLAVTKFYAR